MAGLGSPKTPRNDETNASAGSVLTRFVLVECYGCYGLLRYAAHMHGSDSVHKKPTEAGLLQLGRGAQRSALPPALRKASVSKAGTCLSFKSRSCTGYAPAMGYKLPSSRTPSPRCNI